MFGCTEYYQARHKTILVVWHLASLSLSDKQDYVPPHAPNLSLCALFFFLHDAGRR